MQLTEEGQVSWRWVVEAQLSPSDPTAWIDITKWVRSLSLTRGRADDLEQPEASVLTLELKNTDGRFTPENSLGAYYPRITVNRGVRATVDVNGTLTRRFTGHTVTWDPGWAVGKPGVARLMSNDALERLSRLQIPEYAAGAVLQAMTPDGYWPLSQSETLFDVSPAGATARTVGTFQRTGEWIMRSRLGDAGLPEYFGPSLAVGDSGGGPGTTSGVPGGAYVDDHVRYGAAEATFSLHFRIFVDMNNPDRNIIGIGRENPGATADTNRFLDARWCIWQAADEVMRYSRSNGDGTQSTFNLTSSNRLAPDLGHSFIFVVTPTRVRIWNSGTLTIDSATDLTPRLAPDPGYRLWMGTFAGDSANDQYDTKSYGGRISDVAIWSRDISGDALFSDLLASWRGWVEDPPGTRIGRLLNVAGWPAADRDLDAGTGKLLPMNQGGTITEEVQRIADSDVGVAYVDADDKVVFEGRRDRWQTRRTIVATYGDGTGETKYRDVEFAYDTAGLYNHVEVSRPVERVTGVIDTEAVKDDSASISSFGRRDLSVEIDNVDLWLFGVTGGLQAMSDRAAWELNQRKDMRLRVTALDIGGISSDAKATAAVSVKLGDLIRLYRRPTGEDVINRRLRIQQIADAVTGGGKFWDVTLATSDAEVDAAVEPFDTARYNQSRFAF